MIDLTGRKRIEVRPFIPNGFEAAGSDRGRIFWKKTLTFYCY